MFTAWHRLVCALSSHIWGGLVTSCEYPGLHVLIWKILITNSYPRYWTEAVIERKRRLTDETMWPSYIPLEILIIFFFHPEKIPILLIQTFFFFSCFLKNAATKLKVAKSKVWSWITTDLRIKPLRGMDNRASLKRPYLLNLNSKWQSKPLCQYNSFQRPIIASRGI